jgi:hypothetical protein
MPSLFRSGIVIIMLVALLPEPACRRASGPPSTYIFALDLSGSIDPHARHDIFAVVEQRVRHIHRGDSVVVIPITGDTIAEVPGRILRFEAPKDREVFDEDLMRLGKDATAKLETMAADAEQHPSPYTDLLDSISIACEEVAALPKENRTAVIFLSDFIHDTPELSFKHDGNLAHIGTAKSFARKLAVPNAGRLEKTIVYLGFVRSTDVAALSPDRREAIREFWRQYLLYCGARVEVASDGPGLLTRFVQKIEQPPLESRNQVATR